MIDYDEVPALSGEAMMLWRALLSAGCVIWRKKNIQLTNP